MLRKLLFILILCMPQLLAAVAASAQETTTNSQKFNPSSASDLSKTGPRESRKVSPVPPPVLGSFEGLNSLSLDAHFYTTPLTLVSISRGNSYFDSLQPNKRSALIARQAWAFCLRSEYTRAINLLNSESKPTADLRSQLSLLRLQARILYESSKAGASAKVLKSIVNGSGFNTADVKSLIAAENISLNSPKYLELSAVLSKHYDKGFLRSHPSLPFKNCSSEKKKVFHGLFCRRTENEILQSFRKEWGTQISGSGFDQRKWKNSFDCATSARLKQVASLVSSNILGKSKSEVRSKLGPPCYYSEAAVYEDYFPLLLIRPASVAFHAPKYDEPVRGKLEPFDHLLCLRAAYDESNKLADLGISRVSFIMLRNGDGIFR